MDRSQFAMANHLAKFPGEFEINKSALHMWWGTRHKTTGKRVLDSLIEAELVDEVTPEAGAYVRVRLNEAGRKAVMEERRRLADLILAGEAA